MDEIIKISYACVISLNIVFDIGVKAVNEKMLVLFDGHIEFVFRFVAERTQTGDELQIPETPLFKIFQNTVDIVRAFSREYGQNIELYPVFRKNIRGFYYFVKSILPVFVHSERIVVKIPVKTQTYEKILLFEESCPFVVNQCSVCL